jgi:predicted ATPase
MKSLADKTLDFGFDISEIVVESVGSDAVNQMIMKMMDTDDEDSTRDLAELTFQRTLGNPFFVIEFMSMLQREDLITFSLGTMQWSYDVRAMADTTVSTANVVELLKSRMEKMPADVRLLLQFAACIGTSFTLETINIIWQEHGTSKSHTFGLLQEMQDEQFIDPYDGNCYKWYHDKVQEAALSLSDIVNETFKFKIGKTLFSERPLCKGSM